ncbi:MAG TPA: TonB-dependent receptor [Thermoanaerobaculia bacterium]|nr:TonB-dependent receptor [Thermoanaerobaculia bacterium]
MALSFVVIGAVAQSPPTTTQQTAKGTTTQTTIDVVGVTPIDGVGVDADKYPANVQFVKPAHSNPAEDLLRHANGIDVSEAQGDRHQPDVAFRGFLASSLLGIPQGLAVFQDGVRLNEPFGDVVDWDILDEPAIDRIEIIPGANAAFGLNALGGVVAMRTRNGFSDPGMSVRLDGGPFGMRDAEVSRGWGRDSAAYFLSASHEQDDGWRERSPARLDHLFGSAQWIRPHGSSDLRISAADTSITGNGAAPVQLLDLDRRAVFTHPDNTRNSSALLSTSNSAMLAAGLLEISGHLRRTITRTVNGDDSPYEPCEDDPGVLCTEAGDPIVDLQGHLFGITAEHPLDAVLNRTTTRQTSLGATAQWTRDQVVLRREHRAAVGISFDRGIISFRSDSEVADLAADRGADGSGRLSADSIVRLDATASNTAIFLTDIIAVTSNVTVTATARMNRTAIELRDRAGDALSGNHRFTSINPSVGITRAFHGVTLFANVNQSSRTPTPVELTCADPEDPCRLPNAFVSDPPLRQVRARSIEAGLRGRLRSENWSLALFQTSNDNDIIFVSSGPLRGDGYFTNVGRTNRRGVEAAIGGEHGRFGWRASGSLLDATFGADFVVPSPHNPNAIDGRMQVLRGDRLPLLPGETARIEAHVRPIAWLNLFADARHRSSEFFRGDEANLERPLKPYAIVDAGISATVTRRITLELSATNLANTRYETFGTFGDASGVLGHAYGDSRFVTPGEPRRIMLALAFR